MMAAVRYLPVWKKDATGVERLEELLWYAKEKPQRFKRLVCIYTEVLPNGNTVTRQVSAGCTTHELLGMMEEVKYEALQDSRT